MIPIVSGKLPGEGRAAGGAAGAAALTAHDVRATWMLSKNASHKSFLTALERRGATAGSQQP